MPPRGGSSAPASGWCEHEPGIGIGANTTLAVVATDAVLTKPQATKVAQVAHDGLARTIDPCHTMLDGDTVFALATGAAGPERPVDVSTVAATAATVLARAVLAAVRAATGLAGIPAICEMERAT